MKICTLCMRKVLEITFAKSITRDGREKIRFHVLLKSYKILSKIMFILDIYGMKLLPIFTVEHHTTFFEIILGD